MDDRQLVAGVRARDAAAERALYDAHVDRVFRLAFRLTGDEDLARDLTQDAFIRAFERIESFRGESSIATWLHAITTSVVLNGLRKVKRFRQREAPFEDGLHVAGTTRRSEPDLQMRMRAAIDALPNGYRTVFLMHDVEGFTHEEIGAALGIESGTSKAQLSRARAKLRIALADFAGEWVS